MAKKRKPTLCSYCGEVTSDWNREHVIPAQLYPLSKSKSKVQRLVVPSCRRCNSSWQDDEVHFRNMMTFIASNPVSKEVWATAMRHLGNQPDGLRRSLEVLQRIEPVEKDGTTDYIIDTEGDEKVMRVVRKVIRGLCHHHRLFCALPDQRVHAKLTEYPFPAGMYDDLTGHHRERDILEYWFELDQFEEAHSVWTLVFFGSVAFLGYVSATEEFSPAWPHMRKGGGGR